MRLMKRAIVRAWGTLAPGHAADWFERLMMTPRRTRRSSAAMPRSRATQRRIPWGDGWLAVTEWGAGPGLLLVHGWGESSGSMWPFVDDLVAAGFRVIATDLPAHGQSSGTRTNYFACAGAVLTVGLAAGPIAGMLTHSFGGPVSLLALRHGLRAGRLVLLSPIKDVTSAAVQVGDAIGLPRRISERMFDRFADRIGLCHADRAADRVVADLTLPLLVIHDSDDVVVAPEHGRRIAAAAPHGEFLATHGLGHRGALEDPVVRARAVEFIARASEDRRSA
jgi:pimeloyl-ACP methyl ester carboxylesterase